MHPFAISSVVRESWSTGAVTACSQGNCKMTTIDRTQIDLDYFRRRAAEERRAEAVSQSVYVREVHFQMAERYADRAWALEEVLDGPYEPSGLWDAKVEMTISQSEIHLAANDVHSIGACCAGPAQSLRTRQPSAERSRTSMASIVSSY